MTRPELIALVWTWDADALRRSLPPETRRAIWRILDALYDDMPIVRMPGYREELRRVLSGMKQTEGVLAVRKELGLET
jgi:hypothetical protein